MKNDETSGVRGGAGRTADDLIVTAIQCAVLATVGLMAYGVIQLVAVVIRHA